MKKLQELSFMEYTKVRDSGMFWVYYPEATGNYHEDVEKSEEVYEALKPDQPNKEDLVENPKPDEQKHQHYFKHWNGKIDPYRICDLFEVNDAAISHAVKKLLCTGNRGHKDFRKDIEDVIDTLERKLEMVDEDNLEKGHETLGFVIEDLKKK